MKFKHYILSPNLDEAAYMGNIGFTEMVEYYQKASNAQIKEIEKVIKKDDWDGFKNLIFKVLGKKLK